MSEEAKRDRHGRSHGETAHGEGGWMGKRDEQDGGAAKLEGPGGKNHVFGVVP